MQVAIRPLSYYQNLLVQPMEYCGIFRGPYQDPSHAVPVLIPDNIVEGPIIGENERGSCQYTYYAPIIWHTHPIITKSYPSAEDILKVIRHQEIQYSFIFTKWGIWDLRMQVGTERPVGSFATDQHPKDLRYEGSLDVNTIIDISEIDNVISKPLYQHTQRGRADVLTPAMFPYFIRYIHDLRTKYPGFAMNLVARNQLRNDEYIFEL